ncbi:MAG: N-acetylmuramoyl-L-alanine amidase [Thermoflexaceae bacterium]|nr:N-acetylmuramoyl-L-alanine amidase [Thermoflexaceae bacterium]
MNTQVKRYKVQYIIKFLIAALVILTCLFYPVTAMAQSAPIIDIQPEDLMDTPKDYVIVLDPGHDLEHTGAWKNGLREEELNMKIAQYCKEALEQYSHVTVYLTHESLDCPYPEGNSSECNKARCYYAYSVHTDLFVSLHVNNCDSSRIRGYELYYPTRNYVPELNGQGYELVKCIASELSALGMRSNGIYTKNSTENKKNDENFYPDGTRADYYNVIRNSKYHNILGIIVEHGYLSNKSDINQFLSSDEKLEALGQADARGIAAYLGLELKTEEEKRHEVEEENQQIMLLDDSLKEKKDNDIIELSPLQKNVLSNFPFMIIDTKEDIADALHIEVFRLEPLINGEVGKFDNLLLSQ